MKRRQNSKVARARAYSRLAAKAERHGQSGAHYRDLADRLYSQARRDKEAQAARDKALAEWRASYGRA